MDLRQVKYALEVAETLNFTRAADNCGVSQPALTSAVKKLEHALGGELFHREGRTTRVSRFGDTMLPQLAKLLAQSNAAMEAARSFQALKKTPLKLGILASIGPEAIAPVLKTFAEKHPGLEVTLEEGKLEDIKLRLDNNTLDAAVVSSADLIAGAYNFDPLYTEDYVVALPPDHWMRDRDFIEFRELDQEEYIDRLSCEMRERIASNCEGYEIEFYARFRSDRESWVAEMVRAGIGFAFLPERVAQTRGLVIKPLRNPAIARTINIMTVLGRQSVPGLKDLLGHLKKEMRSDAMAAHHRADNKIDMARTALDLASHIRAQTNAGQLISRFPMLTLRQAYEVQDRVVDALVRDGQTSVSGWKIGGANKRVLAQMGISEPFFGRMLKDGEIANGGRVPIRDFDHVSPELEICFEMSRDLVGPDLSQEEVLAAIGRVYVGFEVTMPRFQDWKFTVVDAVAANSGFAGYVLGDFVDVSDSQDLANLSAHLLVDGAIVQEGTTQNALGHPLVSLTTAVKQLAQLGHKMRAGDLYFSGSLTPKLHLRGPCLLEGQVAGIGTVQAEFVQK